MAINHQPHWRLTCQAGILSLHTCQQTHRRQKHCICTPSQEAPFSPLLPAPGFTAYATGFVIVFSPTYAPSGSSTHPFLQQLPHNAQPTSLAMWIRNVLSMLYLAHLSQKNWGNELHHLHYRVLLVSPFSFISLHELILLKVPISSHSYMGSVLHRWVQLQRRNQHSSWKHQTWQVVFMSQKRHSGSIYFHALMGRFSSML